uniref:SDR family NAD(P)-dependent oxidoreductase n=1 Tax=Streptomyces sp. NRRL F-5727 TaxID=1463871 RepID=UPI003B63FF1A
TGAAAALGTLAGLPGRAHLVRADVTEGLDTPCDEAERLFGGLDILVHNTSHFQPAPTLTTPTAPDLTGRTALVTGATRGAGLATARKLCARGAHVLLNYAHDDTGAAAALGTLAGLPGRAHLVRADVTEGLDTPCD